MTKLVKTSYQNIAKTKKRNPTNFGCKITEALPTMGLVTISKLEIFRKPKNKLAEDSCDFLLDISDVFIFFPGE